MERLNINKIKQLVEKEKIRWTNHVMIRILQRNITQSDIKKVLMNGEIIEKYDDSYPYPSCLVYGINLDGQILHVVCGANEEELWIITAYHPDKREWKEDLKTRKEIK